MKYFIIVLLLICTLPKDLRSQSIGNLPSPNNVTYDPLTIGATIPNIPLSKMVNRPGNVKSLYELTKGKLLIIDCFATSCGSCISILPTLDSLQKIFQNDIVILPVTYESRATIEKFLLKHPEFNKIPFVTDDTAILQLFPHRYIPHEVWINREGKYITSTFDESVNTINIKKALSADYLSLISKQDNMGYNDSIPLLADRQGAIDSAFKFRSMLTSFKDGLGTSVHVFFDKNKKLTKIVCTNLDMLKMYNIAYSKFVYGTVNRNRMDFPIIDSSEYFPAKSNHSQRDWIVRHGYCYEMIVSHPISDSLFYRYMMEDLNRYFEIKGSIAIKKIACWKLIRTDKDDNLLKSKGGEISYAHTGNLRNCPLENMVTFLNGYQDMEPIIDETGYDKPVDLDIDFVHDYERGYYPNIAVIKQCLNKYGLDLIKVYQNFPVLKLEHKKGEY